MKIVDAKVIICCSGRNLVTLKVVTEDGIYGLGDATLIGRELAVASYLSDHVVPLLIGRDARRIEDTGQYFVQGSLVAPRAADHGRRSRPWTRHSGTLKQNRSTRRSITCSREHHAMRFSYTVTPAEQKSKEPLPNITRPATRLYGLNRGSPGLESTYGVGKGLGHYEPAEKGALSENVGRRKRT